MFTHIYGLDIETDTTPLTDEEKAAGHTSRGLNPSISRIVNVAISYEGGSIVFNGENEADIINAVCDWFKRATPGLIVTWNGSVFDLPFISDRAEKFGMFEEETGLYLVADPAILPKYEPLPGHAGGYFATWDADFDDHPTRHHAHLDVAYCYKQAAEAAGVPWSLKPVAKSIGLDPIVVDASKIHELSAAEQDAYVASDATVTRALALRLLTGRL